MRMKLWGHSLFYFVAFIIFICLLLRAPTLRSAYKKKADFGKSLQRALWMLSALVCVIFAGFAIIRHMQKANILPFAGVMILCAVFMLICGLLYVYLLIEERKWKKNNPDYALLIPEERGNLLRKEKIELLSVDEEVLHLQKTAGKSGDKILLRAGKHKLEFAFYAEKNAGRRSFVQLIFQGEENFYCEKGKTYLVRADEEKKRFVIEEDVGSSGNKWML